jgi:hypothetical protein
LIRATAAVVLASVAIVSPAPAQRNDTVAGVETSDHDSTLQLVLGPIDGDRGEALAFGVSGLSRDVLTAAADKLSAEDWKQVWNVFVAGEQAVGILGAYRVTREGVWLVPSFPPEPGVRYRAVLEPVVLAVRLGEDSIPADDFDWLTSLRPVRSDLILDGPPPGPPARVAAVYPSTNEVPENLLRFYVQFTAPMSRGSVGRWIHLEDARGNPIELPCLDLAEELWDKDTRRLTLLLDPGRIKLGLRPQREEGPALEADHDVFLVVDSRWPDATGRPLGESWRRGFRVGPPDRTAVDPSRWRLAVPEARGRDALRVTFDEPLDHALLHRLVWIEDATGNTIEGSIEIGSAERSWSFVPSSPWSAGDYALRAGRRLEDLAGNRVGRPFEVDLTKTGAEADARGGDEIPASLPFTISMPSSSQQ